MKKSKSGRSASHLWAHESLILPDRLAAAIIDHARTGYPEEVCGLVAGVAGRATALYPGRNISSTPTVTYELDHETLARMVDFEDAGLELVAIYHSHPRGPETPSPTDIAHAFYPDSVYLIVSLATADGPVVRGFRIAEESVREIAVKSKDEGDARSPAKMIPPPDSRLLDSGAGFSYTSDR